MLQTLTRCEIEKPMKMSVIIPCYNAEQWVADAIHSVAEQTYTPHEIIVVDDASTDDSLNAIRSSGVDVRLFHTKRANAAGARNVGIEFAEGEWVAFQDADDRWYPDHLERAMKLLGSSEDVAYLSLTDRVNGSGEVTMARNPWPLSEPTSGLTHRRCVELWQIHRNFYSLIAVLARLDRLREIDGFDVTQTKAHDVEMWLRLIHGRTWSYNPVATTVHATQRPGAITQSGQAESQYFVMRAVHKNRERYGNTATYDRLLEQTALKAIGSALSVGGREDQCRIRRLALPYLRSHQRTLFAKLGRWAALYRIAYQLRSWVRRRQPSRQHSRAISR